MNFIKLTRQKTLVFFGLGEKSLRCRNYVFNETKQLASMDTNSCANALLESLFEEAKMNISFEKFSEAFLLIVLKWLPVSQFSLKRERILRIKSDLNISKATF